MRRGGHGAPPPGRCAGGCTGATRARRRGHAARFATRDRGALLAQRTIGCALNKKMPFNHRARISVGHAAGVYSLPSGRPGWQPLGSRLACPLNDVNGEQLESRMAPPCARARHSHRRSQCDDQLMVVIPARGCSQHRPRPRPPSSRLRGPVTQRSAMQSRATGKGGCQSLQACEHTARKHAGAIRTEQVAQPRRKLRPAHATAGRPPGASTGSLLIRRARRRRCLRVRALAPARAAGFLGHAAQRLLDVIASSAPRWLGALGAGSLHAHCGL